MAHLDNIKWHIEYAAYDLWIGFLHKTKLIKPYINYWAKRKTGSCISCGNCCTDPCKGIFTGVCPHYNRKTKKCMDYDNRPQGCKDGPISPTIARLDNCQGYKFKRRFD
jgi:hypothetical protein